MTLVNTEDGRVVMACCGGEPGRHETWCPVGGQGRETDESRRTRALESIARSLEAIAQALTSPDSVETGPGSGSPYEAVMPSTSGFAYYDLDGVRHRPQCRRLRVEGAECDCGADS